MNDGNECFISVDVETAGPVPGEFSMLSIGACVISAPEQAFECELKPINANSIPEAMKVTGMSLDELSKTGLEPSEAMMRFADWIATVVSSKQHPIFVGLNAPFDWSFINYYFHKYHSKNPFGFTALDIKAFYFGKFGGAWGDAKSSLISAHLKPKLTGDHTALADARYQAELFRLMQEHDSIGG